MTIDEDFPGKASHCNMFFLSRCRIGEKGTNTGKLAKGKRTIVKTIKANKCNDKHNNESKYRLLKESS